MTTQQLDLFVTIAAPDTRSDLLELAALDDMPNATMTETQWARWEWLREQYGPVLCFRLRDWGRIGELARKEAGG